MAQKVQVILTDDVDGTTADETVIFGLDGVSYEIDLSAANASDLRSSLAGWISKARKVNGRGGRKLGRVGGPKQDLTAIRNWARDNGYNVSDRGRVSADIKAAYERANG